MDSAWREEGREVGSPEYLTGTATVSKAHCEDWFYKKQKERGSIVYIIHYAYLLSVPALLQFLLLPRNKASTPWAQPQGTPTGPDPRGPLRLRDTSLPWATIRSSERLEVCRSAHSALVYPDHSVATLPSFGSCDGTFLDFPHFFCWFHLSSICRFLPLPQTLQVPPRASFSALFSHSLLSPWPSWTILLRLLASLIPHERSPDLSPEHQTQVSKCLLGISPECSTITSESSSKTEFMIFPTKLILHSKYPLSRSIAAPSTQSATSENRKSPTSLSHIPLSPSLQVAPNPFLHSRAPPCQAQRLHSVLYAMDELASQQILLLPFILPSNPSFTTTRVSFVKHISTSVSLLSKVLKASHPTTHKRISKWLAKHANFVWSCHISQHSPEYTTLKLHKSTRDSQNQLWHFTHSYSVPAVPTAWRTPIYTSGPHANIIYSARCSPTPHLLWVCYSTLYAPEMLWTQF